MSHTNLVTWSSDNSWIYDPVNGFSGGETGQFQITGGNGWTPGLYTINRALYYGTQDGNQVMLNLSGDPAAKSATGGIGDVYAASAPAVQSVTVSPASASLAAGATQQFTAAVAVTGGAAQTVTWSASSGTISTSGLFTAPGATQPVTITATSTADTTKSGTATANVTAQAAQHTNLVAWSGDRSWIYDPVNGFVGNEAQLGDYLQIVGGSGWTTGTYQINKVQVTAGDGSDGQVMMVNIGQFVQPAGQRSGQGNLLALTAGTIAVGTITSTTIAVSSTPPPNASGAVTYQWYLSQQLNDSAQADNLVAGATTASYTFANLSPGSPYFAFLEQTDAQGKNAFIGPLAFKTAGSGATLIVVDGNSIAYGGDSNVGGPAAMLQTILGPNYVVANVAVPAHSTANLAQDASTRVDALFSAAQYPGGQIHFFWEGSNDIFQDGLTGDQSYAAQIAYCGARRANALAKDGSKIITLVGTCLPRGQQGPNTFESNRLPLNSALRKAPSASVDGIVDFAADQRWGQSGDEANGTYYHSPSTTPGQTSGDDEVHPLDAAYALMVEYLAGTALTVLAQKSAFAAPVVTASALAVAVSANPISLAGGAAQQFGAEVFGGTNPSQSVTWATSAGSITGAGLLTAPAATSAAQTATVTATSTQDPTKSGTATVTVSAAAAPPSVNPVVADLDFSIGAPQASLSDPNTALVSGSDGFVHIPVSAKNAAGIPVDLTLQVGGAYVYPVSVCVSATPSPLATSYQAGDWLFVNGVSYARLQVGQANVLAPGNYRVYVNVASEFELLSSGLLAVVA